jgi:hypothetical protein
MLAVLQQQFETAKADMDPARAAALTAHVTAMGAPASGAVMRSPCACVGV